MREDWVECNFEDLLDYEQPTKYIVESTKYSDDYKIPVLTAGKTFIKGYTNESNGIFDNLPTIIFDDFTTASQYVDFKFKVKSSAMKILVPTSKLVNMKFAFNCMRANQVRNDTHKRYWISVYAKKKLLLPSLVEQRAIVTKTEELFSDLDNGIANLKKAREQLKIYRQAVLKKAFEGELTKEWRDKQSNLPTAEELLQQIKEERQNHYNKQIKDWKKVVKEWEKKGNEGKKSTKPKVPKELPPLTEEDLKELPKLPEGWMWIKQGNVIEEPKYGTSKKCDYKSNGIGVLRIPNVLDKVIDASDLKYAEFSDEEIDIYSLKENDILTIRSNGSVNIVGKCALIKKKDEKYLYAGYLIRLRPYLNLINSYFLIHSLSSITLRLQIENKAKSTSGVNNINSGELSNLIISLCSLPEQHQIVQEIESRLSVCDKVEQSITESLEKAKALRQSILKKTFEGRLLSEAEVKACKQEPDYEPASILLERIKKEKSAKMHSGVSRKKN